MKAAALALCLTAAVGCGQTLPVDAIERIAHAVNAMRESYLALCNGREESAECTHIRAEVNDAIDVYTRANDALAGDAPK